MKAPQFASTLRRSLSVPSAYRAEQNAVLQTRLGLLAPVVASLTVAWIVLDAVGLGASTLEATAPLRLLVASALFVLWRVRKRLPVQAALIAFVWLQALGFGAIGYLLESQAHSPSLGYGLFAFVIAAQLAIFPLPWLHSLRLGLAPAVLLVGDAALRNALPGSEFVNDA